MIQPLLRSRHFAGRSGTCRLELGKGIETGTGLVPVDARAGNLGLGTLTLLQRSIVSCRVQRGLGRFQTIFAVNALLLIILGWAIPAAAEATTPNPSSPAITAIMKNTSA